MAYSTISKQKQYSAVAEEGRLGYGKDLLPSQIDTLDQSTIKLIKSMSYGEIIS